MNKEQFLSELSRRLDGLNGNDLYRTLEYYAEMIDDRMEEGMSGRAGRPRSHCPGNYAGRARPGIGKARRERRSR